jgi:hypothetical protein
MGCSGTSAENGLRGPLEQAGDSRGGRSRFRVRGTRNRLYQTARAIFFVVIDVSSTTRMATRKEFCVAICHDSPRPMALDKGLQGSPFSDSRIFSTTDNPPFSCLNP